MLHLASRTLAGRRSAGRRSANRRGVVSRSSGAKYEAAWLRPKPCATAKDIEMVQRMLLLLLIQVLLLPTTMTVFAIVPMIGPGHVDAEVGPVTEPEGQRYNARRTLSRIIHPPNNTFVPTTKGQYCLNPHKKTSLLYTQPLTKVFRRSGGTAGGTTTISPCRSVVGRCRFFPPLLSVASGRHAPRPVFPSNGRPFRMMMIRRSTTHHTPGLCGTPDDAPPAEGTRGVAPVKRVAPRSVPIPHGTKNQVDRGVYGKTKREVTVTKTTTTTSTIIIIIMKKQPFLAPPLFLLLLLLLVTCCWLLFVRRRRSKLQTALITTRPTLPPAIFWSDRLAHNPLQRSDSGRRRRLVSGLAHELG
jgi:hypothetical protein